MVIYPSLCWSSLHNWIAKSTQSQGLMVKFPGFSAEKNPPFWMLSQFVTSCNHIPEIKDVGLNKIRRMPIEQETFRSMNSVAIQPHLVGKVLET